MGMEMGERIIIDTTTKSETQSGPVAVISPEQGEKTMEQSPLMRDYALANKQNYAKLMKVDYNWLDLQCDKILATLEEFTLAEKLGIIGQVSDYLVQKHVDENTVD